MQDKTKTAVCGVDVGKYHHEACILDRAGNILGQTIRFANTREGFEKLTSEIDARLPRQSLTMAVEATGHYGQNLLHVFSDRENIEVASINPLLVQKYSSKQLRKVKTDKTDSLRIAQAGQAANLNSWQTPETLRSLTRFHKRLIRTQSKVKEEIINLLDQICPEFTQLFSNPFQKGPMALLKKFPDFRQWEKARIRRLRAVLNTASRKGCTEKQITDLKQQVVNSLGAAARTDASTMILSMLLDQLQSLEQQLQTLKKKVEADIQTNPKAQSLSAIPGISLFGAGVILSEIGDIDRFKNSRQIAAFAGLDPSVAQSGQYLRKQGNHISKRGSKYLRTQLYYAARTAIRVDGKYKEWAEVKRKEGKHYTKVVIAVARKLSVQIFHTLKDIPRTKKSPNGT
jgi:transposase